MDIIEILPETDDRLRELAVNGAEALDKDAFPGNVWGAEAFRQNIINNYDHLFVAVEPDKAAASGSYDATAEPDKAAAVKSGNAIAEWDKAAVPEPEKAAAAEPGVATAEPDETSETELNKAALAGSCNAAAIKTDRYSMTESGSVPTMEAGRVIGFAVLRVLDVADILRISVAGDSRRQGIGRGLLGHMLKKAEEDGADIVFLEVRASNIPAIRMYEQAGFKTTEIKKGYYDAPIEDAVVMNYKILPSCMG